MCGFLGILGEISHDNLELRRKVDQSLNSFRTRGPDSKQIQHLDNLILGFNRLSINNLQSGEQPRLFKKSIDDTSVLCFNGEIFNYKELELNYLNQPFNRDEAQVLVDLYKNFGNNIFELLNGQFAIAIFDDSLKRLTLARDPFGIRPLFFGFDNKLSSYVFASDIRAFHSLGINLEADINQLARLHLTWSTASGKTIWEGINQVKPGFYYEIPFKDQSLKLVTENKYFDMTALIANQNKTKRIELNNDSICEFRYELSNSVKRQTMSDVGYTSYLSGGIDSSVIAYELSQLSNSLSTYSIEFSDQAYDESDKQKLVSSFLKTQHNFVSINDCDIANEFSFAVSNIQQPFFRTAPIPSLLLARLISQNSNKVALTGEGADEILLGYDIFRENICLEFIKSKPDSKWRYKVFDNLYSYLPQFKDKRFRKLTIDTLLREGEYGILNPLKSRLGNNLRTIKTFRECEEITKTCVDSLINEYENKFKNYELDDIDCIQLFEIENLLAGYLLSSQGDRAAMSASIETRFPYLDLEFVKYCFGIPRSHKLKGTFFKRILRKSYENLLPHEIINAPKIAYQAPEARAILQNKDILNNLRNQNNAVYSIYDFNKINKIINRLKSSKSDARGSFGDNMSICMASSLSLLLN